MKRTEKMLVGGLVLVLFGWLVGPSLLDLVTGSGARHEKQKLSLGRELAQLTKLNEWKKQSLAAPEDGDAHRAEEQYRNWIWALAEEVGAFKELNVAPNSRGGSRRGRGLVPVQVQLTGLAKFGDVRRFLFHFYQADLLHQVISLRMKSKSQQDNDPELEVTLIAEGLSLSYAAEELAGRDTLFAQTRLTTESDEARLKAVLDLADASAFPKEKSLLVRVGDQYVEINASEKVADDEDGAVRWTFAPDGPARALQADTIAELVPVAESMTGIALKDYKLVNPFALYEATLVVFGFKEITVGQAFRLRALVEGVRPGMQTTFELGEHPPGMTIETVVNDDGEYEGRIAWQTEEDQEPGQASLEVFAKIEGRSSRLTRTPDSLSWSARRVAVARNERPKMGSLKSFSVTAGTPVEFTASATDPEDGRLAFALAAGSPRGASIDSGSGKFRWVPQAPGEFQVTVEVSDSGTPRQKDSQSVTIKVALDSAQFTVLTASVTRDGRPEAWLFDRLKNQRVVLTPKTRFRYGDIEAEVVSIEERAVVFRVGKEERKLVLGESLQKLKPAANDDEPSEKSVTDEPATKKSATDVPASKKSATDEPASKKSATEEPATKKSATDKPATKKSATDKPATKKSATDEPASKKSATDESASKKPAT